MRIPTLLAIALVLAVVGTILLYEAPNTGAAEPVESGEFWFDPDPGHLLLWVQQKGNGSSTYSLFAGGRLLIERTDRYGNPGDSPTETALSHKQISALISLAVDGGLMEWHLNGVERAIPRQVYFSSAGEYQMTLRLNLPHYQRPGQDDAPAVAEISLRSPTSQPNAGTEVQALAQIMRKLRRYQTEAGR